MKKTTSLKLSQNALYYAVASFFLFGLLLGIMGFKESQKALEAAENEQERIKAKRVKVLSIIGMSGPVILLLLQLMGGDLSIRGIMWNSWLITVVAIVCIFFTG